MERSKPDPETWQSLEQDTSQVSFSSLPEDEVKSEPSVTVSSTTTNTGDQIISALVSSGTDDPKVEMHVEKRGSFLGKYLFKIMIHSKKILFNRMG